MNKEEPYCLKIWNTFKEHLQNKLKPYLDNPHFDWRIDSERTRFLMNEILSQVAQSMELEIQFEVPFRLDATLLSTGRFHYKIPQIVIESENNTESAEQEFYKLCMVNAPVKILVVYDNQSDHLTYFGKDWFDFIRSDFQEQNLDPGFMAVLIFHRDQLTIPQSIHYLPGNSIATYS
jgi:hypothetical protein